MTSPHILVVEDEALVAAERQHLAAEAALRASEERHRAFVQYSSEAIWCLELDQALDVTLPLEEQIDWLYTHARVVSANQSLAAMHGYPGDGQVLGLRLGNLLPRLAKDNLAYLREFITSKYRLRERDSQELSSTGEVLHFTSSLVGHVEDGRLYRIWGVKRDITDRKRAEEASQQAARDWQTTFDATNDAIWILDADHLVRRANKASERIFGRANSELVGRHCWTIVCGTAEPCSDCPFQRSRHSGRRETMELERDGRWLAITVDPIRNASGRHAGAVHMASDITERKQAEQEREKLQIQLDHARKMESVGRLAGGVAHDFNNMLGVILGYVELAMDQVGQTQPLFGYLTEIREAGERSADITRQLLAFARRQTVAPKVLDLNDTLEGMLNILHRLIGENIDLAWLPGQDLPPIKIDPSQIDQILANLCVNARDAITDVGRVTIETANAVFDEAYCAVHTGFVPGEYVLLAVSDNGCGMDDETLANIFEPFFTTKDVGKGTGLGLPTVYGIVKQNRGFVDVSSEPGHGTTFRIYLPSHVNKERQLRQAAGLTPPVTKGKETILLVEDEPAILKMTVIMLQQKGYTVLAAASPAEAIRLAESAPSRIDLLITDVVMPEMNGRDLARNLLQLYPNLKRLFMSGYTANVIAHHGVLDSGVHFIQKPFTLEALLVQLRAALDNP